MQPGTGNPSALEEGLVELHARKQRLEAQLYQLWIVMDRCAIDDVTVSRCGGDRQRIRRLADTSDLNWCNGDTAHSCNASRANLRPSDPILQSRAHLDGDSSPQQHAGDHVTNQFINSFTL